MEGTGVLFSLSSEPRLAFSMGIILSDGRRALLRTKGGASGVEGSPFDQRGSKKPEMEAQGSAPFFLHGFKFSPGDRER